MLKVFSEQDFQDFEVVVANQSDDNAIKKLCANYSELNITHIPTGHLKRQASANTDTTVDDSRGAVVKVLFQDDFLNGCDALAKIADAFETPELGWCLTGSEHSHDGASLTRPFVPRNHDHIHYGKTPVVAPRLWRFGAKRRRALTKTWSG